MRRFIYALYFLVIFFCFFPYLALLPLSTDSQPNALLITILALPFLLATNSKNTISKDFVNLFIIAFIGCFLIVFTDNKISSIRSYGNYLSLFVITYACYQFMKRYGIIPFKFFKISVIIWFIVGFTQLFIYHDFLLFLIPRNFQAGVIASTLSLSNSRGVLGLAPEPTYYGWVCIQFIIYASLNYSKEKGFVKYILLLLLQLIFLSRSSGALLALIISLIVIGTYNLMKFNIKSLGYIVLGAIIVVFLLFIISNTDTRMGYFVRNITSGENMLVEDGSANERFNHVLISVQGCMNNYGLPNGYESFGDYYFHRVSTSLSELQGDYISSRGYTGNKIMSSLGGMMYELGFFVSLCFFAILFRIFKVARKNNLFLFCLVLYIISITNALPFAQGFVCLLLANMLYIKDSLKTI